MQLAPKVVHCFLSLFSLVALLATFAPSAYSHPHAFVITSYGVVFDGQGIKGIRVSWVFDEMYSTATAAEFDLDGNGSFSENESKELVTLGNESLPDFNFFTHIHIDGKPYEVKSVRDFSIGFEKGVLTYDFFIDCPVKASPKGNTLKISPHDKDFFLAMLFNEDQPFTIENADPYNVSTKIGEDQETLIMFNSTHPIALHLDFQKK